MELETVNKLYLELSQFATAKTKNDLELEKILAAIEAMRVAGGRAEFQAAFDKAKKLAMAHNVGVQGPSASGRSPGTTG